MKKTREEYYCDLCGSLYEKSAKTFEGFSPYKEISIMFKSSRMAKPILSRASVDLCEQCFARYKRHLPIGVAKNCCYSPDKFYWKKKETEIHNEEE